MIMILETKEWVIKALRIGHCIKVISVKEPLDLTKNTKMFVKNGRRVIEKIGELEMSNDLISQDVLLAEPPKGGGAK